MSIKAVSWALEQYVSDPVAKLVLVGIADRYNDEQGYAWPSVAWLSKAASVTDRTVQRKIKLLEEQGFLATAMRKGATTHYHLHIEGVTPSVGGDKFTGVTIACRGRGDNCASDEQYNNNKTNNKNASKKVQKVSEWTPSDEDIAYAAELGLNAGEILTDIRLWDEKNGNKAAYASVRAFWQQWCRREAKRAPAASKRDTGANRGSGKVTARQEAMVDNLMAKYIKAYKTDDPDMIRDALMTMMAQGLDINGWYKMGHGLKHHTEF